MQELKRSCTVKGFSENKKDVCHVAVSANSPFLGGDTRHAAALCCSLLRECEGAGNNSGKDGRQL